jgi:hypothetical protein
MSVRISHIVTSQEAIKKTTTIELPLLTMNDLGKKFPLNKILVPGKSCKPTLIRFVRLIAMNIKCEFYH